METSTRQWENIHDREQQIHNLSHLGPEHLIISETIFLKRSLLCTRLVLLVLIVCPFLKSRVNPIPVYCKYLGMTIDYSTDKTIKFQMFDYLEESIESLPDDLEVNGFTTTPAADHLFFGEP